MHRLAEGIKNKKERALARAISLVENDHPDKLGLLKDIHPMTGNAHYIGITGAPGAGKSSLVDCLIRELRNQGLTVGVVAVDPTSPFSGGALLGDRVRMEKHFTDSGVFIRSMGTKGSLGGLARTTKEAVRLMDAYGLDIILIETVGVGQSELDIMKIADTIAVVLNPGSGDVVQVYKAGIMEIADLFVINKADLSGVPKLMTQLRGLLDLVKHDSPWRPPIVKTVSLKAEGVDKLAEALERHRQQLIETGEGNDRRKENLQQEVLEVVHYELMRKLTEHEKKKGMTWLDDVQSGNIDPYSAAETILNEWLNSAEEGKGVHIGEKTGSFHGER